MPLLLAALHDPSTFPRDAAFALPRSDALSLPPSRSLRRACYTRRYGHPLAGGSGRWGAAMRSFTPGVNFGEFLLGVVRNSAFAGPSGYR
jgi:hypothetical protein